MTCYYFVPLVFFLLSSTAGAAIAPRSAKDFSVQLSHLRHQILQLQNKFLNTLQDDRAEVNALKILKQLVALQKEEQTLAQHRLTELKVMVSRLESRRTSLHHQIEQEKKIIHHLLIEVDRSMRRLSTLFLRPELESIESPHRHLLANLVNHSVKEIETLGVDLTDADELESRVSEEQEQLAYLLQDMEEQESLLRFHSSLRLDLLKRSQKERLSQLQNYQKLKAVEAQVSGLIQQLNARKELEKIKDIERTASKAILTGDFAKQKGHLRLPLAGAIVSRFGRNFDNRSRLYVFKKGIDIETQNQQNVSAIYFGRVVYAGELSSYGQVTIIEHGASYYSLYGRLGKVLKKTGDLVAQGDVIGSSNAEGTPVYFEIRSRNIPVNPLRWIGN